MTLLRLRRLRNEPQEILHGLDDDTGALEHHEVVSVDNPELALWDQLMMLHRRGNRDERISVSVENQHRALVTLQNGPQRPLIGVIEIPRIFHIQREPIQKAKVRRTFAKQPQCSELCSVKNVVCRVVPE